MRSIEKKKISKTKQLIKCNSKVGAGIIYHTQKLLI